MQTRQRKLSFEALMFSLMMLILMPGLFPEGLGALATQLLLLLTLLACLYLASFESMQFRIGLVLAALALLARIPYPSAYEEMIRIAGMGFEVAFIVHICSTIFRMILKAGSVTPQLIYASLCLYILMALGWAVTYLLLLAFNPEAIANTTGTNQISEMIYFSFVTISTLGYCDILPVSHLARSLATLEAIIGQLYLVVIVASLVGIRINSRSVHESESDSQ